MKTRFTQLYKVLLLTTFVSPVIFGQDKKSWDFGVSARVGRDFYKIEYKDSYTSNKFSSDNSIAVGIFTEKRFKPISLIGYVEYGRANNTRDLCECSRTASVWIRDVKYHNVFGGLRARRYIFDRAKINPFIEIGMQADWFLGFSQKLNNDKSRYHSGAYDYDRFVPSGIGAIGVKFSSFTLSAEYQRNLTKGFAVDETRNYLKPYIIRQGYSIKLSYGFIKF